MRLALCAALALAIVAPAAAAGAQAADVPSLKVNGVEVRIGEDSAAALAALRDSANVTYQDAFKSWEIDRKRAAGRGDSTFLGWINFTNGVVSTLSKTYDIGNGRDLSAAYTEALFDVQRGVNEACHTSYLRANDGHVTQLQTVCGPNSLTFGLSHVGKAGEGVSATNISVLVRAPAAKGR